MRGGAGVSLPSSFPGDELQCNPLCAGSHTVLSLVEAGCSVHIIDNFWNSFSSVVERVKELAGDKASK